MKRTLILFIFIGFLLAAGTVAAADTDDSQPLYQFLAGTYTVVGKALNSSKTYLGETVFTLEGDHLAVARRINGKTVRGIGKIDHALRADEVKVLRVTYAQRGKEYEITYLWQSDLDNYARLSGYLYERGKQTNVPGLEVLFIQRVAK